MSLALALLVPVLAAATPSAPLERMKANVAQIPQSPEQERWRANVALWEARAQAKLDSQKAEASLAAIKGNVAAIADADEKERWLANVALWNAAFHPAGNAAQRAAFARMRKNVKNIAERTERERWQANCDLWGDSLLH